MSKTARKTDTSLASLLPGSDSAGRGDERGASRYELRDTLAETSVREATFGEFLAALKQAGRPAA